MAVVLICMAAASALVGAASPARADPSFLAPEYSSAACTPLAGATRLGIGPQQWNSSVGLPLTPTGTPAAQRIVIGEFDTTANATSVNALLAQCGLPTVTLGTDTNPWYPPATAPGDEATLDASIVAAALPPNADIVMVNTSSSWGWYGLLVTAADACGLVWTGDPTAAPPTLSKGPSYPAGGCIVSISYGGSEAAYGGTQDKTYSDVMMNQLAAMGVIVVVSAGDEGSGGCISTTGSNFGNATLVSVTFAAVASNVMTVTTAAAHGFHAGQQVFLSSISPELDRMYTILSTPSTTTFTVAVTHPDRVNTAFTAQASVSFGTLVPQFLATNPNTLAVGGTQWDSQTTSMAVGLELAYTPGALVQNYVWKDSNANPNCGNLPNFPYSGGEGTGGGQSSGYAMPSYQQSAAMSSYPTAASRRMIPDLAALAGWPMYAIANWGLGITGAGVSSNVATLYLGGPTSITALETIVVSGMVAPFTALNGTWTVATSSGGILTFAVTRADVTAQYVNAGTATQTCPSYPCEPEVFPWTPVVGTSAAAPLVAVGIANVNAVLTARGLSPIVNDGSAMDVHSIVYGSGYRTAFTDVVYGNNDVHGLGGWDALSGYDMVTGMGVPNFATLSDLLVQQLTPAAPSGGGTSAPAAPTTVTTPLTPDPVKVNTGPSVPILTPPTLAYLGPGALASTGPRTAQAPRARAGRPATLTVRNRPAIDLPANHWTVPVIRVPGHPDAITVLMRVAGAWVSLVPARVAGRAVTLPALRLSRPGDYPLRLTTPNGVVYQAVIHIAARRG